VVVIRRARLDDVPTITAIQNEFHATKAIAWTDKAHTVDERTAWFHAKGDAGHPVLVACEHDGEHDDGDDGTVVGMACYGDFRDTARWPGYRVTCELTVFVTGSAWGTGVGRQLIDELCRLAADDGKHVIVAAVDGENEASIRFHERLGFTEVARMPEVGTRFGRWLTLVLLQRRLTDAPPPPSADS
jgi:phosphinothricin acetyltransferase